MNLLPASEGLVVFDIKWATDTAGPSPDNNMRTELFLLGCKKAKEGNPCVGCFNSVTWDIGKAEHSRDPIEIADFIAETAPNKYITIGGGEPTDQIDNLMPLVKRLKEHGFHIMMYTWRSLDDILSGHYINDTDPIEVSNFGTYWEDTSKFNYKFRELLKYLDIVVDGEFKADERMYQGDLGDGMLSSIGSGNQIIWDVKEKNDTKSAICLGKRMRDLVGLYIKPDTNDLVYITKE